MVQSVKKYLEVMGVKKVLVPTGVKGIKRLNAQKMDLTDLFSAALSRSKNPNGERFSKLLQLKALLMDKMNFRAL